MLYLRPKKLDTHGGALDMSILLHRSAAEQIGIKQGQLALLYLRGIEIGVTVEITDTQIEPDRIGLSANIWQKYPVSELEYVVLRPFVQSKSVQYIRDKYKGIPFTYEKLHAIMQDIVTYKLTPVELTYFAAIGFMENYTMQELYYLTKAMAETGDRLDFKGLGRPVVDKHSIGGMPGKGITPIMVPILAKMGFTVPNTSSRAITTPAGTADILETLMPVALEREVLYKTVYQQGACLAWGGSLNLAPADDVLIQVEKPFHMESTDKFIVSILAKKVATGVQYVLIDLPYGKYGKITRNQVPMVAKKFKLLGEKFGMKVIPYPRIAYGTDGPGIGPVLEAKDFLAVLEQLPERPLPLENIALDMVATLAAATGKYKNKQEALKHARQILMSGQALEQFWSIAMAQGATRQVSSRSLEPGIFNHQVIAPKDTPKGTIRFWDNSEIVKITRLLGTPGDKEAGIYLHKFIGDQVRPGDLVMTLYAQSAERLKLAVEYLNEHKIPFVIKQTKLKTPKSKLLAAKVRNKFLKRDLS